MEVLNIKHANGEMSLLVDGFFPCTQHASKIIFPLIGQWCSEETKAELMKELLELKDGYEAWMEMFKDKKDRHGKAEYKRADAQRKRMEKNIQWLEKVSRQ